MKGFYERVRSEGAGFQGIDLYCQDEGDEVKLKGKKTKKTKKEKAFLGREEQNSSLSTNAARRMTLPQTPAGIQCL